MTWQGRRVLVTGAGGFIGSHLTERLVELGAAPRALVHYRGDGSWGWLDRSPVRGEIEVIAGDVRDRDSVARAMQGVEVVFHLAALIAIPYSYQAPGSFVETNVVGTLHVLQAALAAGARRVVQTSTSEVYGTAVDRERPMGEGHPLHGQSPYAASKIGADKLAEAFWCSYGLPVVTVRPFNTFGPRQSARAIVPTIITQLLTDSRVRLGNLTPVRDLNFVGNIVDGFIRAGQAASVAGRTFNLGSGETISIGDLAQLIARVLGTAIEVTCEDERVRPSGSEVMRLRADGTQARERLGWTPTVGLEDGLQITSAWMREHLERYRPGVYAV